MKVLDDHVDQDCGNVKIKHVYALVRPERRVHAEPLQVALQVARAGGTRTGQLLRPEAAVRARADR